MSRDDEPTVKGRKAPQKTGGGSERKAKTVRKSGRKAKEKVEPAAAPAAEAPKAPASAPPTEPRAAKKPASSRIDAARIAAPRSRLR
ncbi:hypothetical protein WOA01_21030 [Methylocystis sp. IM2]|uniref:hypothetical protein n=1 Tax=unclassified Methylocystis TaxID=2625913 RepID=UPI0030F71CD0